MDQVSAILINKALDGLSMRMTAIAENIANSQTANYRPVRVSFEEALAEAANMSVQSIRDVQPRMELSPLSKNGGGVRLDMEMAMAASTGARYAALIDVLNRQTQLSRLAASGGQ
ncbi:hypothetical protein [Sphingorhabdus sp. Alg239-R122]|uniref:flagellar basal body rod protein FlgB n=1 Tax=Sphingorhabdus sp. Alg239-R122 TaxID=2305989 RepID=UPI0013DD56FF|nr:hypothetical protein [Sphingorhabdus sp. Alg239-R122]